MWIQAVNIGLTTDELLLFRLALLGWMMDTRDHLFQDPVKMGHRLRRSVADEKAGDS